MELGYFFFQAGFRQGSITSMPTMIDNRENERTEPLVRTDTGMEAAEIADDGTENDTETPTVLVSEAKEATESTQPPTPELEEVQDIRDDVRVSFSDEQMVETIQEALNEPASMADRVRGLFMCVVLSGMTVMLATSGFFWWTPLYRY